MSKQLGIVMSCLALVALLASACQPSPAATAAPKPAAAAGTVLWTFQTKGAVWASPAVYDGVVYFGSDDHFVYAVDAGSQQLKWKFETGDLVRSRPAFADETIYFTSDDGNLYALNARDGKETWRLDIGNAKVKRQPLRKGYDYLQSSPAVAGGVVYVGSADSNLYAVDAKTGQEKWRFAARGAARWPMRTSPTIANGIVYTGNGWDTLFAVDARTGQETWHFDGCGNQPTPAVVDGVVYEGGRPGMVYALDALTGQKKWEFSYGAGMFVESSATLVDGVVYVGSSYTSAFFALDSATGKKKWAFPTSGSAWSSPAVANGVAYIGSNNEYIKEGYFWAVDTQTGQAKWQLKITSTLDTAGVYGVVSSPAVANGVVYFGGLDGNLYAVSTAL